MNAKPVDGPGAVVVCKYQPELLVALLDQHADVFLVLDGIDRRLSAPDQELLDRCRRVYAISSFDSLSELSIVAVDVRSAGEVIAVLNNDEVSQFGAGYLKLLFGIAADPLHPVAHRDKRLMKQLVRAAGVPTADFRSLPDAADSTVVASIARELSAPLIVKPAAGFGASTTVKVDDAGDLGTVARNLTFDTLQRSRQLIVEEYVPGAELAVDAIWSGGKALTFVVYQYLRPRMNVQDNLLDGCTILPEEDRPELYDRIREMHARVNSALGIENGLSHLELFERPDGELIFSEVASRPGGGWAQQMIGAYHGHSTESLTASAVLTGTVPPCQRARPHVGAVSIRPATHGVITAMPTDDELRRHPAVLGWRRCREVGERARLNTPSDFYLFVILGADTAEGIVEACVEATRTFTIETEAVD